MNYLQLVQVLARQIDEYNPTSLTNQSAQILRLADNVNRAYSDLWQTLGFANESAEASTTVSTTPGQNYVTVSFRQLYQVAVANEPVMQILPWPEFENRSRGDALPFISKVEGVPRICSLYQRRVYMYPVPDTTLTIEIRGRANFTPLVADTDTPLFGTELDTLIIDYALMLQREYENDPAIATQRERVQLMIGEYRKNMRGHSEMPPVMMLEEDYQELRTGDYYARY